MVTNDANFFFLFSDYIYIYIYHNTYLSVTLHFLASEGSIIIKSNSDFPLFFIVFLYFSSVIDRKLIYCITCTS